MPPIEVGLTRAIGAVNADIGRKVSSETPGTVTPPATAVGRLAVTRPAVAASLPLDPGSAPVDLDRVTEIRKALERGDYPLNPARIADAMIAGGLFLRIARS